MTLAEQHPGPRLGPRAGRARRDRRRRVDRLIMHDLSGYLTSKVFEERVGLPVAHPDRVIHRLRPPVLAPDRARGRHARAQPRVGAQRTASSCSTAAAATSTTPSCRQGWCSRGRSSSAPTATRPCTAPLGAFAAGARQRLPRRHSVLPYGKAWFRVPETVRIRISAGAGTGRGAARDVALWLLGRSARAALIYKALEFARPVRQSLSVLGPLAVPADRRRRRRQVRLRRAGRGDARVPGRARPRRRRAAAADERRRGRRRALGVRRRRPRAAGRLPAHGRQRRPVGEVAGTPRAVGRARRPRRRAPRGLRARRRSCCAAAGCTRTCG